MHEVLRSAGYPEYTCELRKYRNWYEVARVSHTDKPGQEVTPEAIGDGDSPALGFHSLGSSPCYA